MENLRVGLVSMQSVVGHVRKNLDAHLRCIAEARSQGVDLLCFPELSLTGYAMPGSSDHPLDDDSEEVRTIVRTTEDSLMAVCFGFADRDDRITQVVAAGGRIVGRYHKTHLGERESPHMVAGDTFPVIHTEKAELGIILCWESHFPEIAATYALKGADVLLVPTASGLSGERRRSAWNRVLPARAYDNTVFVCACNACGDNGMGTEFGGGCVAFDPRGFVLGEDYSGEEMTVVDLDASVLGPIRSPGYRTMKDLYFLDKRRPDIYFR
ncbi:MAG: hypothetical protein MJZ38_06670 [archaeon]|nr:hypothetical protein [archaeon]